MKVRYEFYVTDLSGSTSAWGYRKDRDAAIRRFAELKKFFSRPEYSDRAVECFKVISRETRHPHGLEEIDNG